MKLTIRCKNPHLWGLKIQTVHGEAVVPVDDSVFTLSKDIGEALLADAKSFDLLGAQGAAETPEEPKAPVEPKAPAPEAPKGPKAPKPPKARAGGSAEDILNEG